MRRRRTALAPRRSSTSRCGGGHARTSSLSGPHLPVGELTRNVSVISASAPAVSDDRKRHCSHFRATSAAGLSAFSHWNVSVCTDPFPGRGVPHSPNTNDTRESPQEPRLVARHPGARLSKLSGAILDRHCASRLHSRSERFAARARRGGRVVGPPCGGTRVGAIESASDVVLFRSLCSSSTPFGGGSFRSFSKVPAQVQWSAWYPSRAL